MSDTSPKGPATHAIFRAQLRHVHSNLHIGLQVLAPLVGDGPEQHEITPNFFYSPNHQSEQKH